ncbi:MAG: hypothetical protein HFH26_12205 [Clostridiaceae bacterium]|nr:hypothetical protein [Clostridiaceae bacterium]
MSQPEILRGKVTGYPSEQKGMVEVALGAFSADGETILARMGQWPGFTGCPKSGTRWKLRCR